MFKFTKFPMIVALAATATLFSCKKDDKKDTPAPIEAGTFTEKEVEIDGKKYTQISGDVTKDYTIKDKTVISGGISVKEGVTLTIEAGATVYAADDKSTPFIAIQKGAKINAVGTKDKVITLTTITELTGTPRAGAWGGLIINGKASVNLTSGEGEGEGGTGKYGGKDDADNSGTIKYVVLKYAGKILGADNELNGFSFNGVGSGTTVEYVQAYMGKDDGFEFFGGTVNVKYAISTGSSDDSFDWTYGYRGKGQFWVAHTKGDRGIEGDGNSKGNANTPFSNPTLSNVTLVGEERSDKTKKHTAMRLREGTKGELYNFIITGFDDKGVKVSNTADTTKLNTITTDYVISDDLILSNSAIFANTSKNFHDDCAVWGTNSKYKNTDVTVTLTDKFVGSATSTKDAKSIDAWFETTNYMGAVKDDASDWTKGWSLNMDGSKR